MGRAGPEEGLPPASPPGGLVRAVGKVGAEHYVWARVRADARWRAVVGRDRPLPTPVPPTDLLHRAADYERAIAECRRLGLPLHHDPSKNWDALGAVSVIVNELGRRPRVLDAGAARYSSILPWLYAYGARDLIGNNLEFSRRHRHGSVVYEPGDITRMPYADGAFDAVTCMSVIEHGVPLEPFLSEAGRVLRPGGLLIVSTDYDHDPPDTSSLTAYGTPVKIFGPADVRDLVSIAAGHGLALLGELQLENAARPVHWRRVGLDFTYIRLTFLRD